MSGGHHSVAPHTKVRVKMKDGSVFVAKFHKTEGKTMFFYDHEPVLLHHMRGGITPYKPLHVHIDKTA